MKKITTLFAFALLLFALPVFSQTYPFMDGFDSYSDFNQPPGYISADAFGKFVVEPASGCAGTKSLTSIMSASNPSDSIATPIIGPTGSSIIVSFYYKVTTATGTSGIQFPIGDALRFYYYTMADTTQNMLVAVYDSTNHVFGAAYAKKSFTINVPTGSNIRLKFKTNHSNTSASSTTYYVRIDSLSVVDAPSNGIGNTSHADAKVTVYPNPATSVATIQTSDFAMNSYEVFNVLGSKVATRTVTPVANGKYDINTASLKPGKYFIVMHNDKEGTTARKMLVVQ